LEAATSGLNGGCSFSPAGDADSVWQKLFDVAWPQ
jgi:hypothetical protein